MSSNAGAPYCMICKHNHYYPCEDDMKRRTKEGKMAFAKVWDETVGTGRKVSEEAINRMLEERFDGAPGWEEIDG